MEKENETTKAGKVKGKGTTKIKPAKERTIEIDRVATQEKVAKETINSLATTSKL